MAQSGSSASTVSKHPTEISAELRKLRAGELSVSEYLEFLVERATGHLVGRVTDAQMQTVRSVVREQLLVDPQLSAEFERLTGQPVPEPPQS